MIHEIKIKLSKKAIDYFDKKIKEKKKRKIELISYLKYKGYLD